MSLLLLCLATYGQTYGEMEQEETGRVDNLSGLDGYVATSNNTLNNASADDAAKIYNVVDSLEIYFRQDVYAVEPHVKDNKESLDLLAEVMAKVMSDSLSTIGKIEINSWTSPEPGERYNEILSRRRSNSLREYILQRWDIPDTMIVATGRGVAWDKLRVLVEESDMRYRDEVLEIIDNEPVETWARVNPDDRWLTLVDSREKHLMDLRGGRAYKYLYDNLYPHLRYGSQISFLYDKIVPIVILPEELNLPEIDVRTVALEGDLYERLPLFAVKSNLLFDVASALNVEVEVPIGRRFSVLGEWMFPWWVAKDNGSALELLQGTIEGRYWFGDRSGKPKLTGWFGGLYISDGLYDMQWKNNGYQGELAKSFGFTTGYAHTINKKETLRLEYSVGIGYFDTDYRYYEGRQNNEYLVWQYDGKYSWFGLTRAKVSLAWMIHINRRVR